MVQKLLRLKAKVSKTFQFLKKKKEEKKYLTPQTEEPNWYITNWIPVFRGWMLRTFGKWSPLMRLKLGILKQLKSLVILEFFCWEAVISMAMPQTPEYGQVKALTEVTTGSWTAHYSLSSGPSTPNHCFQETLLPKRPLPATLAPSLVLQWLCSSLQKGFSPPSHRIME